MVAMDTLSKQLWTHHESVLAYVRNRAPSDADDIVQRAFMKALERLATLRDPLRLRAWLFQIVRSEMLDHLRTQTRHREDQLEEDFDGAVTEAPVEGACPCVLEQLKLLAPEDREVLVGTVLEDETSTTLARRKDESVSAVTVRAHRARRKLRDRLQKHCGTTSLAACLSCSCTERGCCGAS